MAGFIPKLRGWVKDQYLLHAPWLSREKDAAFYDDLFANTEEYHKYFTHSRYYGLWTVIIDRLRADPPGQVLEIGCGVGQFAQALQLSLPGVGYHGFDLSAEAIRRAQEASPSFQFEVANALETDLYNTANYEAVVCTEVLEHVTEDLHILGALRSGTRCLGSVPNYDHGSHVRFFPDEAAVTERYAACFTSMSVTTIPMGKEGHRIYLIDGTIA